MGGRRKKKSKDTEAPLFEGNPELVSIGTFFHRWCQRHSVIPKFDLNYSGKPPKILFSYDLTVENIPYTGHGEAFKKKEAYSKAILNFIPHLIELGLLKPEECPQIEEESEEEIKNNGNWTEENSKYRLNRFFFINKINVTVNFKPADIATERNLGMICEMSAYIPHVDRNIVATGKASSKNGASKKAAKNFIRQLYHLDLIEAYSETEKKPPMPQQNLPPELNFTLSPNIESEIDATLQLFGIKPVTAISQVKQEEESVPISLVPDLKFEEILSPSAPKSSFDKSFSMKWSPPEMNYNPWTHSAINEGPFHNLNLDKISLKLKQDTSKEEVPPAPSKGKDVTSYPIYAYKKQILDTIHANPVAIVKGSPGSGKTSQICQYILDHYIDSGVGAHCNVIVTHPSIGGLSLVPYEIAAQRGEEMGQSIGQYKKLGVTFPRPYGATMFIPFNLLLRKIEFGLKGITHIIFDEFHLRDMFGDLLLIILKYMLKSYPSLRVIILTPPINIKKLVSYFGRPPAVVEIVEKYHPVQEWFIEDFIEKSGFTLGESIKKESQITWDESKSDVEDDDDMSEDDEEEKPPEGEAMQGVQPKKEKDTLTLPSDVSKETMLDLATKKYLFSTTLGILKFIDQMDVPGDVMVIFSVKKVVLAFKRFLEHHQLELFSKFGYSVVCEGQPRYAREKAQQPEPAGRRKIILTTSIAAASINMKNLVFIVESCRTKQLRYNETANFSFTAGWASKETLNLQKIRITKSGSGHMFYLCTKAQYALFDNEVVPQITTHKIHELVMLIKLLRLGSPASFLAEALDPPPEQAIEKAVEWLKFLKIIDCTMELTSYGRLLGRLPIDPRGSRLIILGCLLNCGDAALTVAVSHYLTFSIFYQHKTLRSLKNNFAGSYFSDHIALVNAFAKWELAKAESDEAAKKYCYINRLNQKTAYSLMNVKNYLKDILISSGIPEQNFVKKEYNMQGSDPTLMSLIAVLTFGLNPNIALYSTTRFHYPHQLTIDHNRHAEFDYFSVSNAFMNSAFPSSVFVYGHQRKKRRYNFKVCKNLTRISPIHLSLLANGKVELIDSTVVFDGWIKMKTEPELMAKLIALRPLIYFLLEVFLKISPSYQLQEKYKRGLQCINNLFTYTYEEHIQSTQTPSQNTSLPPAKRIKIETTQPAM